MYRALLLYRRLLNSRRCPGILKRPLVWAYGKLFKSLFSDRHTRVRPYPIPIPGHASPVTLWLDWCDYTDAWYIFTGGIGDDLNLRFALKVLRPSDVFVDVGANVGYFAISAAMVHPGLKALAIEPLKRNVHIIRKNLDSNPVEGVELLPNAVGSPPGERTIRYRMLNSGSPSTVGFFGEGDPLVDAFMCEETVQVRGLDEILGAQDLSSCRLMKLDVQGAEAEVLASAEQLLKEQRLDYLLMEYNQSAYGEEGALEHLSAFGYRPFEIQPDLSLRPVEADQLVPKRDYVFACSAEA